MIHPPCGRTHIPGVRLHFPWQMAIIPAPCPILCLAFHSVSFRPFHRVPFGKAISMADFGTLARPIHPWVAAGQGKVRFGVSMLFRSDWSTYVAWVQEAEALGFDSIWAQDHPPRMPDWATTLAALAMVTRTIRLGSYVNSIYYRTPTLLARMAADVDRMSNGRFVLGIGIGFGAAEFAQFGLTLPSVRERQEALEETLQIIAGLWGPQPFTFAGKHFQVEEATSAPPSTRSGCRS